MWLYCTNLTLYSDICLHCCLCCYRLMFWGLVSNCCLHGPSAQSAFSSTFEALIKFWDPSKCCWIFIGNSKEESGTVRTECVTSLSWQPCTLLLLVLLLTGTCDTPTLPAAEGNNWWSPHSSDSFSDFYCIHNKTEAKVLFSNFHQTAKFLINVAHLWLLQLNCCSWESILQPSCCQADLLKVVPCDLSSDVFGLVCLQALLTYTEVKKKLCSKGLKDSFWLGQ